MIPRTYPSTYASNGQQQMLCVFLTDVTGLKRWTDYIPVKLSQGGTENSYNTNGYIDIAVVTRTSTMVPFKDFVPVYSEPTATDAWQVNSVGYIPYGYALFGSANMIQDFTSGSALDPRITFTRASNATVVGPDGAVQYAPHNLLTFSEQFDASAWAKTNVTVVANAAVAPDGTTTADELTATAADCTIGRYGTATTAGVLHTGSIHLRANTPTSVRIYLVDAGGGSGADFTVCNVTTTWQRFTVQRTTSAGTTAIGFQIGGASTFSTGEVIQAWGAQLNVGALQPYYPTTVKNLLGFTQEFDNAGWTKSNSTVTANATTAPDGSFTADKWIENAGTGAKQIFQSVGWLSGTRYAWSVYAKAAERVWLYFSPSGTVFPAGGVGGYVNLSTGATSGVGANCTISTVDVGNGWRRCCIFVTAGATVTNPGIDIRLSSTGSDAGSYTGDGTSGIFIWGAQLSDSASLDPYVYNPGAAPAAAAYYGPRFDYDPVTLAPRGLLIEEQRTNSIRNNTMQGAVAGAIGSGGALPTNWIYSASGLTVTVVGTGQQKGINYVDVRLQGTASTNFATVVFDNGISGYVTGASFTLSTYAQVLDGAFPSGGTASLVARYNLSPSGSTDISTSVTSLLNALGPFETTRLTSSGTTTGNLSGNGIAFLILNYPTGSSVNITLRIGLPQLELGAFATSPIPTSTAAATRAADVAVMTGANFSNWYNQSEGTLFAEFIRSGDGIVSGGGTATPRLLNVDDGTNSLQVRFNSSITIESASNTGIYIARSWSAAAVNKTAMAYKTDDSSFSVNASVASDNTGSAAATMTSIKFGTNTAGSGGFLNGHIRRIGFFPRRLTNAELVAITA
jgi:hypothetical protein